MNHHLQLVFSQCRNNTEVRSCLLAALDQLVKTHLEHGTTCTSFRDDYEDACELAWHRTAVLTEQEIRVQQRWEAAQLARLERLQSDAVHAAPLTTNEEAMLSSSTVDPEMKL